MSKNNIHSIFEPTEHPDEATLWLYSRGELTRKDMHRVEQHLIDCPMCSDVVDGFSIYESESSLNASKNRAYLMFERALKKRKKNKILYLAMAAIFVLVAVSSVVLIQDIFQKRTQENSQISQYTPQKEDRKITGTEGVIMEDDTAIGNVAMNGQKEEKPTLLEETIETETKVDDLLSEPEQEFEEEAGLDMKSGEAVTDEMKKPSDTTDEKQQNDINLLAGVAEDSERNIQDYEDVSELEVKEETVYVADRAEQDFDNNIIDDKKGEPDVTADRDDTVLRRGEKSRETVASKASVDAAEKTASNEVEKNPLYQQGVEAKSAGNLNKALRLFSRIPKGDSLYWNAQWQIANIHRSRGDTVKALKVYSIIKDTTNPHQHSARFFFDLLNTDDQ